jgi:hypothetical protein
MSLGEILANLDRYVYQKKAGAEMVARNIAAKAQAKAKADRPWTDRTGAARDELHAGVLWQDFALLLYLAHGVEYGPYLELCNDGKYAVLEKTLNSFGDELYNHVKRLMES